MKSWCIIDNGSKFSDTVEINLAFIYQRSGSNVLHKLLIILSICDVHFSLKLMFSLCACLIRLLVFFIIRVIIFVVRALVSLFLSELATGHLWMNELMIFIDVGVVAAHAHALSTVPHCDLASLIISKFVFKFK